MVQMAEANGRFQRFQVWRSKALLSSLLTVESRLADGTVRAGRPRRYYHVMPDGRRALNEARAATNRLWNGFKWPLSGTA